MDITPAHGTHVPKVPRALRRPVGWCCRSESRWYSLSQCVAVFPLGRLPAALACCACLPQAAAVVAACWRPCSAERCTTTHCQARRTSADFAVQEHQRGLGTCCLLATRTDYGCGVCRATNFWGSRFVCYALHDHDPKGTGSRQVATQWFCSATFAVISMLPASRGDPPDPPTFPELGTCPSTHSHNMPDATSSQKPLSPRDAGCTGPGGTHPFGGRNVGRLPSVSTHACSHAKPGTAQWRKSGRIAASAHHPALQLARRDGVRFCSPWTVRLQSLHAHQRHCLRFASPT